MKTRIPLPVLFGGATTALCVTLVLTAYGAFSKVPSRALPRSGYVLETEFRSLLPRGGRYLVVSDYCHVCTERAKVYVNVVASDSSTALIVEAERQNSTFRPLLSVVPRVARRVVYTEHGALEGMLHVAVTPAVVRTDGRGAVVSADVSRLGWYIPIVTPGLWWQGWKRLYKRVTGRVY